MSAHLSAHRIKHYRQRTLSPADLLSADDHLATCEACREMIIGVEQRGAAFMSLRADLQVLASTAAFEHPAYEQFAAYIDDALDDVNREILTSHLELCSQCAAELHDLQAFKATLVTHIHIAEQKPFIQPTSWKKFVSAWRLPSSLTQLPIAGAMAVALLFITAGGVLWFTWIMTRAPQTHVAERNQPPVVAEVPPVEPAEQSNETITGNTVSQIQPVAPTPTPQIVIALNDGGSRVTLDRRGYLEGMESVSPSSQQAIKKALATQQVESSPALAELTGKAGTLMGGTGVGVSFGLISPVGTIVKTDRPTLRWQTLRGATNYRVDIYSSSFNKVAASPLLSSTEWKVPRSLPRGRIYSWQVAAIKDGKEVTAPAAPAPEAKFKVLERAKAEELERAQQSHPNSHLLRGILYAHDNLLDEAEQEFRALLHENPKSPVALKLLRSVQAQRRRR